MALSLSRTAGESIVLRTPAGETLATLTVKDIEAMASGAMTARLVIDAPRQVEILRGELVHGG
jgi:sRNA-binding carbon storage regulator CsrA